MVWALHSLSYIFVFWSSKCVGFFLVEANDSNLSLVRIILFSLCKKDKGSSIDSLEAYLL